MATEPEQVGIGLLDPRGDKATFKNWKEYNKFVVNQIKTANEAFAEIGLESKIHTNWINVNGTVALSHLENATVSRLGLITVDHFIFNENEMSNLSSLSMTFLLSGAVGPG